jgi:hypothetical protein
MCRYTGESRRSRDPCVSLDTLAGTASRRFAELAPLDVFLACDESRYITGEIIGATSGKPLS